MYLRFIIRLRLLYMQQMFALLAYPQPLQSPLAFLFTRETREKLWELVNGAILGAFSVLMLLFNVWRVIFFLLLVDIFCGLDADTS